MDMDRCLLLERESNGERWRGEEEEGGGRGRGVRKRDRAKKRKTKIGGEGKKMERYYDKNEREID